MARSSQSWAFLSASAMVSSAEMTCDVACGIHELAFNDAGKVVLDVPNDLNSQLHKNGIIGAPPQVGMVGVTSPGLTLKPATTQCW